MVASKPSKILYFWLFLLPALTLYALFFVTPLLQGVQYSFTDWNGIVPEIPLTMEKNEFCGTVMAKVPKTQDRALLRRFYRPDSSGEQYLLQHWQATPAGNRSLTTAERRKIKRILKTAGVTPVKFIGWANYRELFQSDARFMPRWQRHYLFNEFDDLPPAITARTFRRDLLKHLPEGAERQFVAANYRLNQAHTVYQLLPGRREAVVERLKAILAAQLYRSILVWGVLGFTLFFTIFNVIGANLLALGLALALDRKFTTGNCLRAIFFLPNVLSLVIVAFLWSFVFRLILPALTGITSWFEPNLAPYTVVVVSVWQSCGYLMIIYLAGLQAIPAELLEVAKVDGASGWQQFRHITRPLLVPALTIGCFYSLANSLKTFEVALALTNGGPAYVTTPIVLDIYNNAFLQNRFGYGTAKAVVLCLIIMLITGVQLTLMKRREVEL